MSCEEKGFCDNCGRYSPCLIFDDDVGIWRCKKCTIDLAKRIEESNREAYEARMKTMGTTHVVLYPDERW